MSTTAARQYNFVDDKNNSIPITSSRVDAELDNIITKLNQKVIISASAPVSPIAGMFWYDSTNKVVKEYRNGEWVLHGAMHYGPSAPATPQFGDIWIDSSGAEAILKYRNKASGAWIALLQSNATPVDNNYFVPTGGVIEWPAAAAPTGFLLCDGSAVSRTTYANLFTVIGETWGAGDGVTTFNVPNCKGRVSIGLDITQTEFDALAKTGGAKTVAHTHSIANSGFGVSGGSVGTVGSGVLVVGSGSAEASETLESLRSSANAITSGAASDTNNLPPYVVINKIIKT